MFEPLHERSWLTPSIRAFIAQQVVAFWGPILCFFVVVIIIGDRQSGDDQSGGPGIWYAFFCGLGCGLAYLYKTVSPRFVRQGRWVWVLPTCLFAFGFADDLLLTRTAQPFVDTVREYFYPAPKDFFFAVFFITFPMLACYAYAIVMIIVASRMERSKILNQ